MGEDFTIISFAREPAREDFYKKCAGVLNRDIRDLGLSCDIEFQTAEPGEDKRDITLLKPSFILKQLLYFCRTVVWVDVDSRFTGKLKLPAGNWDVGFIPHPEYRGVKKYGWATNGIHVWRYTGASLKFLRAWDYLCRWKGLCDYDDHARCEAVRYLMKNREYKEISLLPHFQKNVVLNPGTDKEDNLERG